jgi:hypothetical protein
MWPQRRFWVRSSVEEVHNVGHRWSGHQDCHLQSWCPLLHKRHQVVVWCHREPEDGPLVVPGKPAQNPADPINVHHCLRNVDHPSKLGWSEELLFYSSDNSVERSPRTLRRTEKGEARKANK